jgi:hypothetical protein
VAKCAGAPADAGAVRLALDEGLTAGFADADPLGDAGPSGLGPTRADPVDWLGPGTLLGPP